MKTNIILILISFVVVATTLFSTSFASATTTGGVTKLYQTIPSIGSNNVSFGDPHRFRISNASNADWLIAVVLVKQVTSTSAVTYLGIFDAATGKEKSMFRFPSHADEKVPFPAYSGWVQTSPPFAQSTQTCNTAVCFYIGTMRGVVAMNLKGQLLWDKKIFEPYELPGVPAHPSWAQWMIGDKGVIWVAFENGVSSAPAFVLNAYSGEILYNDAWTTAAYTKIWVIQRDMVVNDYGFPSAVFYGIYDRSQQLVGMVLRAVVAPMPQESGFNLGTLFKNMSLTYTKYLWDNPNFDVDAVDEDNASQYQSIYGYFEPTLSHRQFGKIAVSERGNEQWSHNVYENVPDFDTYAYRGDFFTLMVHANATLQLQRYGAQSGSVKWNVVTPSYSDTSAILLVSSGIAASFGLNTGEINIFSAETGDVVGKIKNAGVKLTTGVAVRKQQQQTAAGNSSILMFGDFSGTWNGYEVSY